MNEEFYLPKGRLIEEDGITRKCEKCQGERGWHIKNGVVTHLPCNTKQKKSG